MEPLRILFIAPYVPSRLRVRPFGFIRSLAQRGHQITVCAVRTDRDDDAAVAALQAESVQVESVPVGALHGLWNCVRRGAGGAPLQALYCYTPALRAQIATLLRTAPRFDVVHVEHLRAALYGDDVATLPRVYDAVDCMTRLLERTRDHGTHWSSRLRSAVDLARTRRFEATVGVRFDRVIATAAADAAALTALAGAGAADASVVRVVANGVDLDYFAPGAGARDPATLVFVGRMSYHANVSAVLSFVDDVLPRIWSRRPDARLVVCGTRPPRAIRALARRFGDRVAVTGSVPDVRPYLRSATVSVSPLPYAAGIQNKLLEAMAMATPVVTSAAGCAGLQTNAGEHLLVGRSATELATQVLALLDDPDLCARIGAAGRRYVETQHRWESVAAQLEAVYHDAMRAAQGRERRAS